MGITMMDDLKNKLIQKLKTLDSKKLFEVPKGHEFKIEVSKNSKYAEKAKLAGNDLFLSSNHDFKVHHRILKSYNESVAYAPINSEDLAVAYGNKAALLLHLRKYAECICEADKALGLTESVALKVKLLCRKAECHTALGSSENRSCLEKARFLMPKIDNTDKLKDKLNNLISQSQIVVEEGKLDTPKQAKRKVQGMKLVANSENSAISNSIALACSDKYGKHLIATRNFEPGEIVFVEKPYMNTVPNDKAFVYCYHCLKYLWTVVPCDHCSWRVFCSIECRDEALGEYHKMECHVVSCMRKLLALKLYLQVPVIISLFFKALKESGGDVHQLQAHLESIDRCNDECTTNFSPNEKFADYKTVFSLPTRTLDKVDFECCLMSAVIALSGLAKFTQLLGTTYDYKDMKKLMKNKTALFIGALLAKFSITITSRCSQRQLYDPDEKPTELRDLPNGGRLIYQRVPEQPLNSLTVLGHFTILTCIPNVMKLYTFENKCIAFALHPIKKGDQITSTSAPFYFDEPKLERQRKYKDLYNRPCECRACLENWPEVGIMATGKVQVTSTTEMRVYTEWKSIVDEFGDGRSKSNHPDVRLLMRAAKLVETAWNDFPLPSPLTVNAIMILMRICDSFYKPVEDHLEFSAPCRNRTQT